MEKIPPNDPLFSQQWHLNNTGQSGGTVGADINVLDAWEIATGDGVVIGVVDGGIDFEHPDLSDQYRADLSYDYADDDVDPSPNPDRSFVASPPESGNSQPGVGATPNENLSTELDSPFISDDLNSLFNSLNNRFGVNTNNDNLVESQLVNTLSASNNSSALAESIQTRSEESQEQVRAIFDQITRQIRRISAPFDIHGTPVTGIAVASGNNEAGIAGVAYNADFAGLRIQFEPGLTFETLDTQIANALSHENQNIDIYNSSWLIEIPLIPLGEATTQALENGIGEGRNGLGNIYIFAAGNLADIGGNVNYSPLTNSRYTIAVGGLDHNGASLNISNPGASLLVSAYVENNQEEGIITTDIAGNVGLSNAEIAAGLNLATNTDNNYINFGGTSAAAPIVSGIVALMLEVNPNLTWRDVQHILVATAQQNDPENGDWIENGAGYLVNHNYGFGSVDANSAVTTARDWQNVAPEIAVTSEFININTKVPDNNSEGISSQITIEESLNVEWVEVITDADLVQEDLTVILTSPDGTDSILSPDNINANREGIWQFTSARHWGESANGEWSLSIIDNEASTRETQWDGWQLKVYGTNNQEIEDRFSEENVVYRFLNNNSGVHFYTSNAEERDFIQENLDNFSYEGVSYGTVDSRGDSNEIAPVYRFLNQNTGVHIYTNSADERDFIRNNLNNFSFEGEVFSAYTSSVAGSIPIYRFFNNDLGTHFYTPSIAERDAVIDNLPNYSSEGIAYYALPVETG